MELRVKFGALTCCYLALLVLTLYDTVQAAPGAEKQSSDPLDDQLISFIDPTSSLSFERMIELLTLATGDSAQSGRGPNEIFYSQAIEHPGPKLADLLNATSYGVDKCTEAHFRRLVAWRNRVNQRTPLARYLKIAIKEQRRFCNDHLNGETAARVASFEPLTSEHFKLFLKEDRVGKDFYVSPDTAITKLRSLIGQPKSAEKPLESVQLQSSQNFLEACQEITRKLGPLVPIRKDHEIFARLPLRNDNCFRAYDFCHHLVDFDFSAELNKLRFLDVQSRQTLSRLSELLEGRAKSLALIKQKATQQQNGPSDDKGRQISRAAVILAQELIGSKRHRKPARKAGEESEIELALKYIQRSCSSSLDLMENLLWLRGQQLKPDKLDPNAERYLRSLSACDQLVQMEGVDILHQGFDGLNAEKRWPDFFNKWLPFFFNRENV